jgi:hypothetical protein
LDAAQRYLLQMPVLKQFVSGISVDPAFEGTASFVIRHSGFVISSVDPAFEETASLDGKGGIRDARLSAAFK